MDIEKTARELLELYALYVAERHQDQPGWSAQDATLFDFMFWLDGSFPRNGRSRPIQEAASGSALS